MIGKATAAFLLSLFQAVALIIVMIISDRYRFKRGSWIKYVGIFLLLFLSCFFVFGYYLGAEENLKSNKYIMTVAGRIQYDATSRSWQKVNETNGFEEMVSNSQCSNSEETTAILEKCILTTASTPIHTLTGLIYYDASSENWIEYNSIDTQKPITEIDRKIAYHYKAGTDAFRKAEKLCIVLPEEKRTIAYSLISATVQASVGAYYGSYPGLIASLILSLTEYGVFVCEQSYKIKEALEEAEYHFQMWVYCMHKKEQEG